MLAYVYKGKNKLALEEVKKPSAKKDSAVIKVNACSICGTDMRLYVHGRSDINENTVIGHEVCGTIVEIGENVSGYMAGDRVTVAPAIGCGECDMCLKGHTNMCSSLLTIGFQFNGGFAEYMEIPAIAFERDNVNKIECDIEDESAALAEPIACVENAHQFLKIQPGEDVAVFGSGFIGCMHAEFAIARGARKVFMIEVMQKRSEQAKKLLDNIDVIDPTKTDFYAKIEGVTGGKGVNVAVTACSVGKAQEQAIDILAKRGRVSLFGGISGESKCFIDSNKIHYNELSVFGVHACTPAQNKKVLKDICNGNINVKKYISRIYALKDIEKAFEAILNENILKAIIKP